MIEDTKKKCSHCKEEKPLNDFYRAGLSYSSWCKKCKKDKYNNQPDYKNAWEELKNKSHYINQHMEDLEELEQKYNLDKEVK